MLPSCQRTPRPFRSPKTMLKEYNNLPMPNQNLSDEEIRPYIRYFKWAEAQPPGSLSSSGVGH
jgi:nitrite reductase (NO-forming)